MNIHIFADQEPGSTGVFYKAFGRAIARELGAGTAGRPPGIVYSMVELGHIEHHPERVAKQIAQKLGEQEVALIVWDTEAHVVQKSNEHLHALRSELITQHKIDERRAHLLLVRPLTEVLYLLDEHLETAFLKWDEGRELPPKGRRARDAGTPRTSRIRTLAQQRRVYGREPTHERAELLSKERVQSVLSVKDDDKTVLAAHMANCLELPTYELPAPGQNRALDALRDWLSVALTAAASASPPKRGRRAR